LKDDVSLKSTQVTQTVVLTFLEMEKPYKENENTDEAEEAKT